MVARDRNIKIVMLGPAACGKSVLVNLLADQADLARVPYRPTSALRILHCDVPGTVSETSLPRRLAVQLWDVGGKKENQHFWNACLYGADGLILVYDSDRSGQVKELQSLLYYFTQRPQSAILKSLPLSNVLSVVRYKTNSPSQLTTSLLPPEFAGKITEVHHSYEDDAAILKNHFTKFVNDISEIKL
ncbi:hypothetical protein RvY_03228 [Ramazzottius varieornatus]|uniref:Uncharacterized protein n=1 Tax=Ramazzottius varieornatus TaxID=947166 RepID=A0A1D1UMB1_RAMVA|nr:hypothetical protein RvY_03228 [Ramazzottius varieornatus]